MGRRKAGTKEKKKTVDVILPTYMPTQKLIDIILILEKQTYPVNQIIIMNTEEKYFNLLFFGNQFLKEHKEISVTHLSKMEFDHGKTRGDAVKQSKADFFVCMTDDAMPKDETLIEELLKPLLEGEAAVSYGRQLPNPDCGVIETYTRSFNYPVEPCIKSFADKERLGIKTYFCSDVCAAYNRKIYDELGGFVTHTLFNEDMIFAAGAIEKGYKIAYVPTAMVYHSHNYKNKEQFHRNFDLGVSQAKHPEIFAKVSSTGEGKKMVKQTAEYLRQNGYRHLVLSLYVTSAWKYLGYKLGLNYARLPEHFVLKCTMNKSYWIKDHILNAAKNIDGNTGYGM